MNGYITQKDCEYLEAYCKAYPIPEWFNPEDEASCISATIAWVVTSIQSIPDDAVFSCPPRYMGHLK